MWNPETDSYFLDFDADNKVAGISVIYQGEVFDISPTEPRFESVKNIIQKKELDTLPKFLNNRVAFETIAANPNFSYQNHVLYYNEEPVPSTLGSQILNYYHLGLNYLNLLTFWENLRKNKNDKVKQDLYSFLKKEEHIILDDGSFIAYRTVGYDFKDIWSKTVDNSIGKIVEMPRAKVDSNPHNSAGPGLHIATLAKAMDFGGWKVGEKKSRLLAVKVFPQDVMVGIDAEGSHAYFRACKYQVMLEITDGIVPNLREFLCKN